MNSLRIENKNAPTFNSWLLGVRWPMGPIGGKIADGCGVMLWLGLQASDQLDLVQSLRYGIKLDEVSILMLMPTVSKSYAIEMLLMIT